MKQGSALLISVMLFITAGSISSCTSGSATSEPDAGGTFAAKLAKPADEADLERQLKDQLKRWYEQQHNRMLYGYRGYGGGIGLVATDSGNTVGPSIATAEGSRPHSETNNQEAGVDEGDLVKTDGANIYLARGSHFFVVSALLPDQSMLISDIDLHEQISELHLYGSRLAVITSGYGYTGVISDSSMAPWMSGRQSTKIYFYDISTPAAPGLVSALDFAGEIQGSRRVDDSLYLVLNNAIRLSDPANPWDYLEEGMYDAEAFKAAAKKALDENLKRIDALTINDLLPKYTVTPHSGGVAGSPVVATAINSGDVYIPLHGNGTDLSLVVKIALSGQTPSVNATTGVLSSWCRIYMTRDNLYLASDNNWIWTEPMQNEALPEYNAEPRTAFHKFSLFGNSKPLYRGSGIVEGWVNDRFSMSAYQEHLRVGTTRGGWWGESVSNQLTILKEKDGELVETGKITGVAPGERIYSMRFDNDKGYMVTFRQTDPLYTLDLSDPAKPRIVGELKVNGFATYIHIINDQLLTIGRSADSTGRVTGNKLQLFDVSNLASPVLVDEYELGEGWSDAVYDPHAFLYYDGLLAIPYFSYSTTSYASGLKIFTIDQSGVTEKGLIPATAITSGYGNYPDTVDRSVIIGSSIYSIAHRSITLADMSLNILSTVDLPESYSWQTYGIMPAEGGSVSSSIVAGGTPAADTQSTNPEPY